MGSTKEFISGMITFVSNENASTLEHPAPNNTLFIHVPPEGKASVVSSRFHIGERDSDGKNSYACVEVFLPPYNPAVEPDPVTSRYKSIPANELYPIDLDTFRLGYIPIIDD